MTKTYRDFNIGEWASSREKRYSAAIDKSQYERHYLQHDGTFDIQTRSSLSEYFYVGYILTFSIDELEQALSSYYKEPVDLNIKRTVKEII